jgi:hypothetical protein
MKEVASRYYYVDQTMKDEVNEACSPRRDTKNAYKTFSPKACKEETTSKICACDEDKIDLTEIFCEVRTVYCPVVGSCERGNETSSSIKCGEFLDQFSDYQLLKDSSPEVHFLFHK